MFEFKHRGLSLSESPLIYSNISPSLVLKFGTHKYNGWSYYLLGLVWFLQTKHKRKTTTCRVFKLPYPKKVHFRLQCTCLQAYKPRRLHSRKYGSLQQDLVKVNVKKTGGFRDRIYIYMLLICINTPLLVKADVTCYLDLHISGSISLYILQSPE